RRGHLKGHLEVPGGLGAASFDSVANDKALNKLTQENKAALVRASGEAGSVLFGKAWEYWDEHGRNDAKEKGRAIETPTPAEFEKWKALLQVVTDDWIKKVDQKGYDGRKLLDDLQAMIKQASS